MHASAGGTYAAGVGIFLQHILSLSDDAHRPRLIPLHG